MSFTALAASISSVAVNADLARLIATGASYVDQRIGNVVNLYGIGFSGTLVGGQSNIVTDDKYNVLRILLSMAEPGAVATLAPSVSSPFMDRYVQGVRQVLYDRVITLASPGPDSVGYMPPTKRVEFFIPLHGRKQYFSGAAAGTQNGETPMLTLVSDSAAAPSPGFVGGTITLFYTD